MRKQKIMFQKLYHRSSSTLSIENMKPSGMSFIWKMFRLEYLLSHWEFDTADSQHRLVQSRIWYVPKIGRRSPYHSRLLCLFHAHGKNLTSKIILKRIFFKHSCLILGTLLIIFLFHAQNRDHKNFLCWEERQKKFHRFLRWPQSCCLSQVAFSGITQNVRE